MKIKDEKKAQDTFDKLESFAAAVALTAEMGRKKMQTYLLEHHESNTIAKQLSVAMTILTNEWQKASNKSSLGFDKSIGLIHKQLFEENKMKLTKTEFSVIAKQKSLILEDMAFENERLKRDTKKVLLHNIGKGMSYSQLEKGLKKAHPNYKSYVGTLFNTGLQRLYKDITFSKIQDTFDSFVFLGPKDSKNRAFCAEHVNRTFNKREAKYIQEQLMGFYNCRHRLYGVHNN